MPTLTGDIADTPDGGQAQGASLYVRRVGAFSRDGEAYLPDRFPVTVATDGTFSISLPAPESGSVEHEIVRAATRAVPIWRLAFFWADAGDKTLAELIADAGVAERPDYLSDHAALTQAHGITAAGAALTTAASAAAQRSALGLGTAATEAAEAFAAAFARGRGKSATATFYAVPGAGGYSSASTSAMPANRDYCEPFWIFHETTFDRIALEVTTAGSGGSVVRLAIYEADADLQPGALVLDAGTVAADSLGQKEITVSLTLPPGRYLKVRNTDSTGLALRVVRCASPGLADTFGASMLVQSMYAARTHAAFPDPGTAWTGRDLAGTEFNHGIFLRGA